MTMLRSGGWILLVWLAATAAAQDVGPFDQLVGLVEPGDGVRVTFSGGREGRARVVAVTPETLLVVTHGQHLDLGEEDVWFIHRRVRDTHAERCLGRVRVRRGPLGGHRPPRDAPSGIGRDAAVEAADHAAGWLPGFASALHRDARAPVNLTPIAGLERHLHQLQGEARLALRAVREAVLERNREGRMA